MDNFFSWIETLAIANEMDNDQLIVVLDKLVTAADESTDMNARVILCHAADLVAYILNVRDCARSIGG